jgi:acyl-CoA synthetase (NDP forming)
VAIARTASWQAWTPRTPVEEGQGVIPLPPIDEPGEILSERASRDVLAAYGIPVAAAEPASSPEEAAAAAERVGFPVVIKADAPGVAHKAAAGLVRTGVATPEQAQEAAFQVMDAARGAGSEPRGVLIEATLRGVELIAGMRRDQAFGAVVLLGVGGALTEVLHEVSVRLCPPSQEDLAEMPGESAAGKLLAASSIDPAPVLDVVGRLSRLALEHPEVLEVDVNPLFAWPGGVAAGDALVIVRRDEGGTGA